MRALSLWKGPIETGERESIASICQAVADKREVHIREMKSRWRDRRITRARQEYYARAIAAGWSSVKVAAYLDRDHSTVLYGARRHAEREGALSL